MTKPVRIENVNIYAVADDDGMVRYFYAADGETACELHREKFSTLPMDVRRVPR